MKFMNWHQLERLLIKLPITIIYSRLFGIYLVSNVIPDKKAVFIHIPKNAGTSIYQGLGLKQENMKHWTAAEFQIYLGARYKEFFKFAFVRHPWERFLSNYWYARMTHSFHHDPQREHKDLNLLRKASILDCANYLMAGKLCHGRKVYTHWSPQYHWLCNKNGELIVDWIGKVENILTDIAELSKEAGIDIRLAHLNASERQYNVEWTTDNRQAYAIIREYYSQDFKLFRYEDI